MTWPMQTCPRGLERNQMHTARLHQRQLLSRSGNLLLTQIVSSLLQESKSIKKVLPVMSKLECTLRNCVMMVLLDCPFRSCILHRCALPILLPLLHHLIATSHSISTTSASAFGVYWSSTATSVHGLLSY